MANKPLHIIAYAAMAALTLSLSACSEKAEKPDTVAADAAKEIYDSLNNGGYEYFTDMTYRPERIPGSYRQQLVANTKMYIAGIREEHKGLDSVSVSACKYDNKEKTAAEAYLLLCFADSTKEEIVVPMTKKGNRWMMK